MKKTFLLSLLALLLSSPAWAYSFKVNDIYYNILSKDDLTCEVTYYYSSSHSVNVYTGKVDIPISVYYSNNIYRVVAIGDNAFSGCTSLTEVNIPSSVTSIGSSAFSGCTSLTEVNIPSSVTSIEESAFYGCTSLTEVTIPNAVTSIEESAFYGCTSLTEVTIGNAVTSIGGSAFYKCTSLTEVTIGNAVTSIGDHVFYNCSSLTEITIPDSVTSIGSSAFSGCKSLTEVTIPNAVTSIGVGAFGNCTSLEKVTFNATACSSAGGFSGGTISSIFGTKLSIVNIGENVTMIPAHLFFGCSGITEITFPKKIESIGHYAFEGCTNLSIVTSLNPEPPACEGSDSFSDDTYNGVLYIPVGTTKAYAKASVWKKFKNIVPLEDPIPPTVTTLEATDIIYSSATFNGSVVSGNEDILNVGFEFGDGSFIYDTTASYIGEGLFSVTIDCNWFPFVKGNTTYYYRAYAETDSGTYYGEDVSFTTGVNGIDGIATDGAEIVGYYSTDGQQITSPTKGVNIVRLSDGTIKKVLVK